jgi:hypothetical protein
MLAHYFREAHSRRGRAVACIAVLVHYQSNYHNFLAPYSVGSNFCDAKSNPDKCASDYGKDAANFVAAPLAIDYCRFVRIYTILH